MKRTFDLGIGMVQFLAFFVCIKATLSSLKVNFGHKIIGIKAVIKLVINYCHI